MRCTPIAVLALTSSLASLSASANAAGFACSAFPIVGEPAGVTDIRSLLAVGDPLNDPTRLQAAIDALRSQRLSRTLIIDNLIGAYCPTVAANDPLTDSERDGRIRSFALRVTGIVYTTENTQEIILDVPLKPDLVDTVEARAEWPGSRRKPWSHRQSPRRSKRLLKRCHQTAISL